MSSAELDNSLLTLKRVKGEGPSASSCNTNGRITTAGSLLFKLILLLLLILPLLLLLVMLLFLLEMELWKESEEEERWRERDGGVPEIERSEDE